MSTRQRRRARGEGGIRERGPDAWEIKFDIGPDPKTGRRVTRFKTVRGSKRDALDELAKLRHHLSEGTLLEPGKITVGAYLDLWLNDYKRARVSAKTFERYAEIVRLHLAPALGAHALAKLSPLHVQGYYGAALTTRRRCRVASGVTIERPPLSARTVKHHHRLLSQALKHAVRLRLLARNVAGDVDPPRPVQREMKILDQAQTMALLKAAETTAIHVPVLIAATTGMRRGEILALRWRDVDLEARTVSVAQTLEETKAGLAFKAPKTERSRRTITLPGLAVEGLQRHRARQAAERLRAGKIWADNDLVCCNALGEPLYPHLLTGAFAELVSRAGLKVRFHDLRHSHISHLLAAGVHPKVASERAGHASVSITLDVYSHLIPGMQEDAAKRIDAALRAHLEPAAAS